MARITTQDRLRDIYGTPGERAVQKQLVKLDRHCRDFIAHSPMMILGTHDPSEGGDVTPRGDQPGFVEVIDDHTIAIPDRLGNNRLDSLVNILNNPKVGLLFFVPGMNEILRINGTAEIRDDDELRARFAVSGKLPATVLQVEIDEVFFHCARALARAKLWDPDGQVDRESFPTLGQILKDQVSEKSDHDVSGWDTSDSYVKTLY